jgi:hypothetical protein
MCFVFETLANSIEHPARGGDTRNKEREDLSLNQKSRTQSGSQRAIKTNHVSKALLITRSI